MGRRSTNAPPASTNASASSNSSVFNVVATFMGAFIPHTGEMLGILFALLIVVPIVELWVIVQVAGSIGLLETIALLIAVSATGAWLLKQQGMATWRRLQATLERGEVPTREVTDGALILFGGALLLTPGFVTDAIGIVLLLPPTRAAIKGAARRSLARWARGRSGVRIHTTTAVSVEPRDNGPTAPSELPPEAAPENGD